MILSDKEMNDIFNDDAYCDKCKSPQTSASCFNCGLREVSKATLCWLKDNLPENPYHHSSDDWFIYDRALSDIRNLIEKEIGDGK